MVIKFEPYWHCKSCFARGQAKMGIPSKCPKCDSEDIYKPTIKKGGPFDVDSLKKY